VIVLFGNYKGKGIKIYVVCSPEEQHPSCCDPQCPCHTADYFDFHFYRDMLEVEE